MFDTEFGIERIVEVKSDMFVLYCPEKRKDEEIGTLDSYNMTFTVDGWCHQFNYKSMWYAGQKSFTDFMEQNFFNKR